MDTRDVGEIERQIAIEEKLLTGAQTLYETLEKRGASIAQLQDAEAERDRCHNRLRYGKFVVATK